MATKKAAKKKASSSATRKSGTVPHSMPKAGKDPKGGLTAKGREFFAQTEGAHLRPGVQGPADTPEKMVRKGSFLRRHFANPRGPMKDDKGEPTRLALSAHAWGEAVPQNKGDAKKLAAEGHELLEQYHKVKDGAAAAKKAAGRKAAAGTGGKTGRKSASTSGSKSSAKKAVKAAGKRASKGTARKAAATSKVATQAGAGHSKQKRAGMKPSPNQASKRASGKVAISPTEGAAGKKSAAKRNAVGAKKAS